jgi:two-component system, cell cycle sensor histidine kinase and response regulator CckA
VEYRAPKQDISAPAPADTSDAPLLLLIDDEMQVRQVVQRQLERLGYRVIAAADGLSGLTSLGAAQPSAALIDMTLPDMDGAEVARAVLERAPDIAVVLMSGYRPEELSARLSDLRIAGFLQKPFSLADLRAILAAALAG